MFYPFKPVKKTNLPAAKDQLALDLFHKAIRMQRKWADWMDRHARRLPLPWLKTMAIMMMFCAVICCIFLLADGLSYKSSGFSIKGKAKTILPDTLHVSHPKK